MIFTFIYQMNFFLQTGSPVSKEKPESTGLSSTSIISRRSSGSSNASSSSSSQPLSPISTVKPTDSIISSNKNAQSSPVISNSPLSSPKIQRDTSSPLPRAESDSYLYGLQSPKQSPHTPRHNSPPRYNRSPRGSSSYMERSPSPSPTTLTFDQSSPSASFHSSHNLLSPYDGSQMGRRSPRRDRSPSPLSFNHPMSNTLPRNFGFRQPGE